MITINYVHEFHYHASDRKRSIQTASGKTLNLPVRRSTEPRLASKCKTCGGSRAILVNVSGDVDGQQYVECPDCEGAR